MTGNNQTSEEFVFSSAYAPYQDFLLYLIDGIDAYWNSKEYEATTPVDGAHMTVSFNDKTKKAAEGGVTLALSNGKSRELEPVVYTELPPQEEWPLYLERFFPLVDDLVSDYQ